jgi:hypothetical protein
MMMMKAAFLALTCLAGVQGFVPSKTLVACSSPTTLLNMNTHDNNSSRSNNHDGIQTTTLASLVTATLLLGNIALVGPAIAASLDDNNAIANFNGGTSTNLIAARSGGRAGGRSAGARAAPRPSSSSSTTTNTRIIERTRYVPSYSSPSVILAPPPVYYNPLPGYGLGLGLNAINQIGNDMRDYRQENEIRDARAQLEQSRMKEAEMEARLRILEQGQVNQQQLTTQQLMMLQQQQKQ